MKAITICQPWAWMIAAGHKGVENRTWSTDYRGPLAIHAGKSRKFLGAIDWIERELNLVVPAVKDLDFGVVVATATLVDCVAWDPRRGKRGERWGLDGDLLAEGPHCLILRDVQRLAKPVPCSGSLHLWEWRGATE